jgi:crotonobetainyl-CoA:carnitine CoA-transferase CaiB-like acyl-CoA transferase
MLEYERYYPEICKLIGREDLINNEKFNTLAAGKINTKELTEILDAWFILQDRDMVSEKLMELDVPFDKILHLTDLPTDPQILANNYIYTAPAKNGTPMLLTASPLHFGNMDLPKHKNAALLGENSKDILKEIGYSDEDVEELLSKKVTSVFE